MSDAGFFQCDTTLEPVAFGQRCPNPECEVGTIVSEDWGSGIPRDDVVLERANPEELLADE